MALYRKKPVVIRAWQFEGAGTEGVCRCREADFFPHVHTAHARQAVRLEVGDWITPEPSGRGFYPIKPDIFEATYEPAGEPVSVIP